MKINVSVIVVNKSKILLMQRSLKDDYFPGAWGIPGGYMEKEDECLEDTAIREVKEELGIEVVPKSIAFNNKNENTDSLYLVYTAELARNNSNKIKLSDEAHDYKWASKNDLESLEFTPYTKERLIKIFKDI
jgi:ADP-ribose pyrophosphatase YjhB (NUDIX family)